MPTALVISRYFPPLGPAGASIRLVKLMKYASELGWSFSVLTQDPDRPVIPEKRLSDNLLPELPETSEILRVGSPFFGAGLLTRLGRALAGDSSLPWGLRVAWHGWRRLRRGGIDLIFVNSPPFTNVAVGYILSVLSGLPLVVDMKDDWTHSPAFFRKGRLRRAVETRIETAIVRRAAAVVTVTPASRDLWRQNYAPRGWGNKIHLIPNGLDLVEYDALRGRNRAPVGERFQILSMAAGYRPDYRDLTPFLDALEGFLRRCPAARGRIRLEFLGEDPDGAYKSRLEKLLPAGAVVYHDVAARGELAERLWQADLFFLVQPRGNTTAVSGTLYEYWAAGKAPVLLIAEPGASSSLVVDHAIGRAFPFDQAEAASRYLEEVFAAFDRSQPLWIERDGVEAFDRRAQVREMLAIWDEALKAIGGGR